MKKLLILLTVLLSGCAAPRYVYVVDDLYFSRPIQRYPNIQFSPVQGYPVIGISPYSYWNWQQYRTHPEKRNVPHIAPRTYNLETYRPQSQLPPPPPQERKEEQRGEAKREAPVRKF